jgi:methylmalonyl-CoA/ethylmalonyl-CoA epimerase
MIEKIDHVGVATQNLDEVRKIFQEILGLKPVFEEIVPDQKVKVLGFKIGESTIEFLEPISDDSPIGKFLEKRGPGLHHLAVKVDDVTKTLHEFKQNNLRVIDETPRKGAEGKLIAFVHPKSTGGILLELSQEDTK